MLPAIKRLSLSCRPLAAVLVGLCATAALGLPSRAAHDVPAADMTAADMPAADMLAVGAELALAAGRLAPQAMLRSGITSGAVALATTLGGDLSRLRAGPFAPLSPLQPQIQVIDLDAPFPGLRLADVLSPGGFAGRYVLGQVHDGRVIEVSGWWGSVLLPLGRRGSGSAGAGGDPRLAGLFANQPDRIGPARGPGRLIGYDLGRGAQPLFRRHGGPGRFLSLPALGPDAGGPAVPDVPTPVPLPGALVLLGAAIAALALVRRQRRPGGPAA